MHPERPSARDLQPNWQSYRHILGEADRTPPFAARRCRKRLQARHGHNSGWQYGWSGIRQNARCRGWTHSSGLQSGIVATPLAAITRRYRRVQLEGDNLKVANDYEEFALADLSTGTQEQVLLALRIGLASYNAGEDRLFLILDDAFQHSDWQRRVHLVNATIGLAQDGWQVFYFTMDDHIRDLFCDKARAALGNDFNYQELPRARLGRVTLTIDSSARSVSVNYMRKTEMHRAILWPPSPGTKLSTAREDLRENRPQDAAEFAAHLVQVRDDRARRLPGVGRSFSRAYLTGSITDLAGQVLRRDHWASAPDHVVRTVTENGRTLKFTSQGFERESAIVSTT